MTKDEALLIGIDALENAENIIFSEWGGNCDEYQDAIKIMKEALKQEQGEPVAWMIEYEALISRTNIGSSLRKFKENWAVCSFVSEDKDSEIEATQWRNRVEKPLYTKPQPAQKPLTFPKEAAAFKAWFDAWWLGDGEQGESIPSQSDPNFSEYVSQYTLGFGAWMAAKKAAHGIKENI